MQTQIYKKKKTFDRVTSFILSDEADNYLNEMTHEYHCSKAEVLRRIVDQSRVEYMKNSLEAQNRRKA